MMFSFITPYYREIMAEPDVDESPKVAGFKVLLRDFNPDMVKAWEDEKAFGDAKFAECFSVSYTSI